MNLIDGGGLALSSFEGYPEVYGFRRTAEAINTWMEKSGKLRSVIQAKFQSGDFQAEKEIRDAMWDKHYCRTDFSFLGDFAIASASILDKDPTSYQILKNPDLEGMLVKGNPEVVKNMMRYFYNATADGSAVLNLSNKQEINTMIFSSRLFNFLVSNFDPNQLAKICPSIEDVRKDKTLEKPAGHVIRGFRLTGEYLGIDWDKVTEWQEVKEILAPKIN